MQCFHADFLPKWSFTVEAEYGSRSHHCDAGYCSLRAANIGCYVRELGPQFVCISNVTSSRVESFSYGIWHSLSLFHCSSGFETGYHYVPPLLSSFCDSLQSRQDYEHTPLHLTVMTVFCLWSLLSKVSVATTFSFGYCCKKHPFPSLHGQSLHL